jgi:hypothetical protein
MVAASSIEQFRPAFDALTSVGIYNINPAVIRDPQETSILSILRRDGDNLASVLLSMAENGGPGFERVADSMRSVVPNLEAMVPARSAPSPPSSSTCATGRTGHRTRSRQWTGIVPCSSVSRSPRQVSIRRRWRC